MKAAAARTGGWATQITLDQPIAWRALDLLATLNTPRLVGVRVADAAGRLSFLSCEDSLAQGEELVAVARLDAEPHAGGPGGRRPRGRRARKWTIGVAGVAAGADCCRGPGRSCGSIASWPRGTKNREEIVALSKAMYVLSPFTSLLVLENEQMYAQYGVDRGRKDHWAMYPCPPQIPVVYEPLAPPQPPDPAAEKPAVKRPTVEEVLATVLVRRPTPVLVWPGEMPATLSSVLDIGVPGNTTVQMQWRPRTAYEMGPFLPPGVRWLTSDMVQVGISPAPSGTSPLVYAMEMSFDDRIKQLMDRFDSLMRDGNFKDAEEQVGREVARRSSTAEWTGPTTPSPSPHRSMPERRAS